jgi:hypothetical protein
MTILTIFKMTIIWEVIDILMQAHYMIVLIITSKFAIQYTTLIINQQLNINLRLYSFKVYMIR